MDTNSVQWDILLLVLGAVLGAVISFAPQWYRQFRERSWVKKTAARKALLDNQKALYDWLIRYYQTKNTINDLFDCRIGNLEIKIPFLTDPAWQNGALMSFETDSLLSYTETTDQKFRVDNRLLAERSALGQRLFNGSTMYLDRLDSKRDNLRLHVKSCEYFQVATSFIGLEEETFRASQKDDLSSLPIRDAYIASSGQVAQLHIKPFAIGCAVAFALKTAESYELLIHTRSHTTATFGGAKGVTPNFGLEPIGGGARNLGRKMGAGFSSKSILYYNFIKEYLEELYNYEELINAVSSRKANPFWFYDLPEAQKLIQMIEKGAFTLEFLGFGFDALNGNAIIALLGILNDEDCANEIKRSLEFNWEIAEKDGRIEFEFVDMFSPELERWLADKRYHTGAAFTLSKALERLQMEPKKQSG